MATTQSVDELIEQVAKMLPVYQQKNNKALKPYLTNLDWNLKKVKGEVSGEKMDAEMWKNHTASDLSNIALLLAKGEPGQEFASSFRDRVKAQEPTQVAAPAIPSPAHSPEVASALPVNEAGMVATPFDVRGFLREKAAHATEKLQWQTSVVDLFKLFGMDSSLASRKKMAQTLGFNDAELDSVGSEDGNELLRTRLVGALAQNQGMIPSMAA